MSLLSPLQVTRFTRLGIQADAIIQAIGLVIADGGTWCDRGEALPIHPTVIERPPTLCDHLQPRAAAE